MTYKGITINYNPITKVYSAQVDSSNLPDSTILFREKSKILSNLKLKIDMFKSL